MHGAEVALTTCHTPARDSAEAPALPLRSGLEEGGRSRECAPGNLPPLLRGTWGFSPARVRGQVAAVRAAAALGPVLAPSCTGCDLGKHADISDKIGIDVL